MNVNFMDACHLRIRGKDIYEDSIKSLKRSYILRKNIETIIRKYSTPILSAFGVASLGISGMLTLKQMERKRMEAAMKLCKDWDDYKRVFVNQLEQEA